MISSQMLSYPNQAAERTTEQRIERSSAIEPLPLNPNLNQFKSYNRIINYASAPNDSFEYNLDANINYLHYQDSCRGGGASTPHYGDGSRMHRHPPINHDN